MLEPPRLSYVAVDQLAAWEKLAEDWPVNEYRGDGTGQIVGRCGECDLGIMLATDGDGKRYVYTHDQWMALVVLHLRNHHSALDPDKG